MAIKGLTVDEIKELSWVQCENETCLKWRRISREDVNMLGDMSSLSWFCQMNKDPSHNKCEDPEEDHRKTIHKADKCGYRYIFSQLPLGSLVWAKMTGYASWPAILSPDPTNGSYVVINDETGTPLQYHVEFLGQHHSHYWVHSGNVEVYGSTPASQPRKVSRYGKKTFRASTNKPKKNEGRITTSLQASIDEAETLKTITCEERLMKCIYTYTPEPEIMTQPNLIGSAEGKQPAIGSTDIDAESHARQQRKRGRPNKSKCQKECCACKCKTMSNLQAAKKPKKKVSFSCQPDDVLHLPSDGHFLSSSSDESFSQEVPVLIRTKEERLQADIQLLRRAEEKFDRRLRKFCVHHGIPVKNSGPQWQGRQVSRYQVYMAVQERGGYNMVSANRAWAKVYHDVCGTSPGTHQSVSTAVKSYYSRNLLPYELYELRSSGECHANKSLSSETKHSKKHKKHRRNKKSENSGSSPFEFTSSGQPTLSIRANYHTDHNQPISSQSQNYGPMTGLGQTYQPAIVTSQPMVRGDGVCQPTGEANLVYDLITRGQLNTEREFTPSSQGIQRVPSPTDALLHTLESVDDVDYLQEESTLALQELQAMERMLGSTDNLAEQTPPSQHASGRLDRPTHIDPIPNSIPFSQKPVLLEFYSMQYDDADYTLMGRQAPVTRVTDDDMHQVPDIRHPMAASSSTSPVAALPGRSEVTFQEEANCPDVYSNILLDMNTMGDEIDRLNKELHHDLMEL